MATVDHVGGPGIRRLAAYIATFFGGCWWITGTRSVGGWTGLVLAVAGVAVVAALVYALYQRIRGGTDRVGLRRAATRYIWINVGQLIGFIAAIAIIRRFHLAGAAAAIIAVVVGLHFLPLARTFAWPPYTWTGIGLIAVAVVGLVAYAVGARAYAATAVCFGVAIVLWAAAATTVARSPSGEPHR